MKTYVVVDIESNGPIPGDYSMTSLGAVVLDDTLEKTFTVNIAPVSDNHDKNRLQYVKTENAVEASVAIGMFRDWITDNVEGEPVFISDNNGYDWMFVCWYFWHFLGENPFGYNSQNINSLYKGTKKNLNVKIGELRSGDLKHEALCDAIDNAKALRKMLEEFQN